MKYQLLLSIALALSVSLIAQDGNGQQPKTDASVERAKQLWELAIAAKGGREKLYQVKSLAITDSRSGYPQVDLYVFPDKFFSWSDVRPTVFSFHASVINFEKNDENVRQEGNQLLLRAGRNALPQLIPAMTKARGAHQLGLAKLVIDADAENEEALAVLRNILKDRNEDPLTRQYAAFPLIRSDKGIAILIGFLRDRETLVRRIGIFACDELTEQNEIPASFNPAAPILKELLKDQDRIVREMAEEVLGQSRHRLKR